MQPSPAVTDTARVPGTHAAMLAPRMSLSSCIRGHIIRSTLEVPPMSEQQRFNHFPATPHCSITWFASGAITGAAFPDDDLPVPASRIVFAGPFSQPSWSYNPGPADVYMLVLMPGALHLLTGIDVTAHTNRLTAFEEVADAAWLDLAQRVQQAPDHESRIALVEDFLEPRWQAARPRNGLHTGWFRDYLTGIALRAVTSDWMRSTRQLERRIKTWTGLPLRQLRSLHRSEQAFHEAYAAMQSGTLSWTDVADATGFADQAHMCRETRRNTGLTATELKWCVENEESYWVYRVVLGERT
jgi:AraC-like DNA-binding protein